MRDPRSRDHTPDSIVDVAIIGAGVVGSAIARELSRYRLEVVLVEAGTDVGAGTSKANTAILHTGFDAQPGTLEASLVRRGWQLMHELGPGLGIPIERTGAVLVAWTAAELAELGPIEEKARANGYDAARRLGVEDLYRLEPHLGPGAVGGLEVPDEHIVCTFTAPLAFATQAIENGTTLLLDSPVSGIARGDNGEHVLELPDGRRLGARWVVNAAGLYSDVIDGLLGHHRFTVTPRRGELIVFDKLARQLVQHVLLPIPTKLGKGVLVAPTIYGNVMLGPTAEAIADKAGTESTEAGLDGLVAKGRRILPALIEEEVTAIYAGLRAATEHADYQIFPDADQRYVCVGGIRSTGLSASLAIGEHVAGLLRDAGVALVAKDEFRPVRMPNIGEARPRPYQDAELIAADPEYGRIVCHCERVTLGEIRDATHATIPARTVDGLGRRTRARLGRCQGFYCAAEVESLLAGVGESVAAPQGMR
jgi:glycerol-3-phosphate dehydrogenase